MKLYSVLLMVACVGCHESTGTTPTPVVEPVSQAVTAVLCQPFDIAWDVDVDGSGPTVRLTPKRAGVTVNEIDERSGDPWQSVNLLTYTIIDSPFIPVSFSAHFDTQYRIRGKVGNCWSSWYEFRVGPANPNASGEALVLHWMPLEEKQWGPETCTPKTFGFWDGQSISLPVHASTELKVRYGDPNHRPGHQPGQQEILSVEGYGWTPDLPDSDKEGEKIFPVTVPVQSVRLRSVSGSLFWACVSGR